MGRTYEALFPPGSVETETIVTMAVTEFEEGAPADFRLEGRIVSNRVEIQPEGLDLHLPVKISIPHFCADADGGKSMYFAQLNTTISHDDEDGDGEGEGEGEGEVKNSAGGATAEGATDAKDEEDPQIGFRIVNDGKFNTATGFASAHVESLGVFYACSKHPDGEDYAVAEVGVPAIHSLASLSWADCKRLANCIPSGPCSVSIR